MSATSASHSTESSSAFLKRPRRRLENVTCRAAALSILFISRRSLAIPAVDPSPWTTQALGRREANPRGSPLQSPRASRGGGGGRARSSEANRRCESWCDALGSGDAKGEGSERKGGGEEGKGICSYWQVGINKPSQARPTRLPMIPANKQSIKTRRTKGSVATGPAGPVIVYAPSPHGTARRGPSQARSTAGSRQ